jgi:hypothetical protein
VPPSDPSPPAPADAALPYVAHLRVYEPLEAFSGRERDRWERYAAAAPSREAVLARERAAARRRLVAAAPSPVPAGESRDALLLQSGGRVLVCPLQTRLRCWHALDTLLDSLPDAVLDAVVPPARRAEVVAERERWLATGADVRVRTRTATWEVPVAWFVLVAPVDRDDPGTGGALRFRTDMAGARTRAARALRTLRDTVGGELELTAEVEEIARWLELFHPRSVVELDYAGLTSLLDGAPRAGDDSAGDVQLGLESLAAGDATAAAAAYRRLTRRWGRVRALARGS